MVDFAGWELPLHYGSQVDEHHAVRRDAGAFDISHMLALDVAGPGAQPFLRRVLANDVGRLASNGKALYTCMLAEDGGVLDDLIVYLVAAGRYRIVANAATAETDCAWLDRLRTPDVSLAPRRDLALIAVQGPSARDKCWVALPELRPAGAPLAPFFGAEAGDAFIARTGYTGEDGVEIMLPGARAPDAWRRLLAAGIRPCGLGARDTLRLEAGLNLYGQDMDRTVTPFECGLGWTVALDGERDFVGKAALIGRAPAWSMLGLVLEGRGGVLRAHQETEGAHGRGSVTSGTFSPTMQASIALARLPTATQAGDRVEVTVRDKRLPARVVRPPFVRHGKVMV
jgi:glycine cleavage system T protein (aminomethyltransferase)